jgi:thiol:disulfide interchange protein
MATYKKGYKKQNSEQVLLKVIVSIIISVFALVAIVWIYDSVTKWQNYEYYTQITEYDGIFDYTDETDTELQDYVVYFYSDSCVNCQEAKSVVLSIARKINRGEEQFFIANTGSMTDETESLDAFLEDIDLTQMVTPLLIIVIDGEFYEVHTGTTDVISALEGIENGDYADFN